MLALHAGVRVHLALGTTDMRRGFDGLAAQVHPVARPATMLQSTSSLSEIWRF